MDQIEIPLPSSTPSLIGTLPSFSILLSTRFGISSQASFYVLSRRNTMPEFSGVFHLRRKSPY